MNIHLKALLAVVLSVTLISQADARDRNDQDNPRGQRPNFSSLDSNSDSSISYDEFSAEELPFGDPETVFNSIDTDGSGEISEEEFRAHKPPRRPRN